jgi:hypothetical protein
MAILQILETEYSQYGQKYTRNAPFVSTQVRQTWEDDDDGREEDVWVMMAPVQIAACLTEPMRVELWSQG